MFVDFESELTPVRVISSYRLLSSPIGVVTRQKSRKCWGIALKFGGKTYYSQRGKRFLSDRNHIMLLPKGAQYEWTCVEQGECIVIDFDALEDGNTLRSVEVTDNGFILSAFSRLERALNSADAVGRLESMHILYELLMLLEKAANKKYVPKDKRHLLDPAMDYIMDHYFDPGISNDQLAQLCGMSTVYFRKTFENVYNSAPIRYLHTVRINKAKAILSGDYDSVSQVAESVGYRSVYHFSKMFRTYTGMSPSDYAKNSKI